MDTNELPLDPDIQAELDDIIAGFQSSSKVLGISPDEPIARAKQATQDLQAARNAHAEVMRDLRDAFRERQ